MQTYYLSGQIKSNASCFDQLCIQKDGYYISYYENGNKQEEGEHINKARTGVWKEWYENGRKKETTTYVNGLKAGLWHTWYENGQPKEQGVNVGDRDTELHLRSKLMNYWDNTGKQLVKDGDGFVTFYFEDTQLISSTGEYKKGFKDGLWKGYTKSGKPKYEETYKKGNVKGISWDQDGNEIKYNNLEEPPSPVGGMVNFYKYVGKNMKYPKDARRRGIQGKVFVQFKVNEGGRLVEVETIKGIGVGCDEEAERVVNNSPEWIPGKQRGQPVKVKMILPLTFKLS